MNLLFDATFGLGWVTALRSIFTIHKEPRPRMLHLYERFPESVKDDEWIGALGEQKHLVISGDSGRKTPRLPDLCRQHKQTHVLLSPTMHMKVNQFGKARAIIVLWPDLVKAYDSERGSRFQIQLVDKDYHSFRLVSKP